MPRAKLTSKGQITVPKKVRESLDLHTGDEIEFIEDSGQFRVSKCVSDDWIEKWSGYLKHLRGRNPDDLIEEMRGR